MLKRTQPMVLALMLLAVSLLAALLAGGVLTSGALAQHEDNSVCPLSDDQTQKSIEAFDKIANVFTQQPRCVNCHGAVDPFAADAKDKHGGDKLDPIMKKVDNPNWDPSNPKEPEFLTEQDDELTFGQCETCHDAFQEHWRIPVKPFFFVGKDAITLCKGQKDIFNFNASAFINHIAHDADPNNPFIQEAFTGRMGLNDVGQGNLLQGHKYPDPPNGVTHQDLIKMAHDWVDAQGGKFRGNLECGCVPHQYALKVQEDLKWNAESIGLQATLVTNNELRVPLTFKDDGSFEGSGTFTRIVNLIVNDPDSGCTGRITPQTVTWKVKGSVVGSDLDHPGMMHIQLEVTNSAETITITNCKDTGNPPPFTIAERSGTPAVPDMPAAVDESQTKDLSAEDIGLSSKVTVTIIQTK